MRHSLFKHVSINVLYCDKIMIWKNISHNCNQLLILSMQEHHLQRAICTGLIIPTPEVTDLADVEAYDKIYPADYKLPRQLIHMQRKNIEILLYIFFFITNMYTLFY